MCVRLVCSYLVQYVSVSPAARPAGGRTAQRTGSSAMAEALEGYRLTSAAMHPHTDRQLSAESEATAYSSATPSQHAAPGAGTDGDADATAPRLTKALQPASSDVTVAQSSDVGVGEERPAYGSGLAVAVAVKHGEDRATATATATTTAAPTTRDHLVAAIMALWRVGDRLDT